MSIITIKDRQFKLSITSEQIREAVRKVGEAINNDLADAYPLFVCVLNGAFMFSGDMMKVVNISVKLRLSSFLLTKAWLARVR